MRFLLVLLSLLSAAAPAADRLRIADRAAFPQPELARAGVCVAYREGGSGWIVTDPVYWLQGTTVAAEIRRRRVGICPDADGKPMSRLSRAEFVRLARAQPCVADPANSREIDVAIIRFRIDDWETPWEKRAANTWRLYRGHFLDQKLEKGSLIEIDAELLGACS